ncbi:MAG TPA: site-specific DNA-methyltransferase [Solirubrobacterales bacterium]|nr:site-specific DNA-methyltransferase [Solirubrobacterales bacterium]
MSLKLDADIALDDPDIAKVIVANPNGDVANRNSKLRKNGDGAEPSRQGFINRLKGDARSIPIDDDCVDLVTTSPPYWKKRDYGVEGQIGQEATYQGYVDAMVECLQEWRRVLRPTGSVFLNIGDTFHNRRLTGIPARVEMAAADDGWIVRNRIIWAKDGGMPDPAQNRLANRHEYIIHLTLGHDYYYDLFGYSRDMGNGANPGDVWKINPRRHMGDHLAPFPTEIAERAILLACPKRVCSKCGTPRRRIVERTTELDPSRPQAKRAMEIAKAAGLTNEHLRAVQATGVSDAGKALRTQNGTGRNAEHVKALAAEAKEVLGGYFREFTFAKRVQTGWTACGCRKRFEPGVVLDPFMGTGTTLDTAHEMSRSAIGIDLAADSA